MNIIIAGDGEVGVHLAKSLTELDYNITVVDPHSELLKRLETETDLMTITGDSTSPQVLKDANVENCDLFLSVLHIGQKTEGQEDGGACDQCRAADPETPRDVP